MADIDRRLVRRVRRHRTDGAVARVERDDRAAGDVVLLVRPRKGDALADRLLGGPLQADVDRQPHGRPGPGIPPDLERALGSAEGVDADLGRARDAPQVAVVGRLDPRLADLVAALVVRLRAPFRLQLLRRDLTDVAEDLSSEGLIGVAARYVC
jgi:hypothetical protein